MAPTLSEHDATKDAVRSGNVLLAGGYAWAATVLYPAAERPGTWPARLCAAFAVAALVAGCLLSHKRFLLGRALALHTFVAGCALTWAFALPAISVDRLDPVRGALGSLAWLLYALAWGVPREPKRVPEDDPAVLAGDHFAPRESQGARSGVALAAGILGAALPLAAAFSVARQDHALFAHTVAAGLAMVVLSASAEVATAQRVRRSGSARQRLGGAVAPLALLFVLLLAGLLGRLGK